MAGMSQRQELRNACSTRFLSYGHLGALTYNEKEKKWETLRTVRPQISPTVHEAVDKEDAYCVFPLRHLSSKVVLDGLATLQQDRAKPPVDGSDRDDNNKSKLASTGRSYCDSRTWHTGRASAEHLQNDASIPAGGYHVNCSKLLDFGNAASTALPAVRSEPMYHSVAASVSGSNRESVRLVKMGDGVLQDLESHARKRSPHLPSISGKDQACWTNRGGPIQQISFAAATGYSSTWMAVRLQSSTTIFHPLVHREPVTPRCETPPSETLPCSVLDANPVLTIPISRTGGHPHADVAFHPQDHYRFALIDEHGNWSVWLLDGHHRESLLSRFWVSLICSGKVWTWEYEKRARASLPYHDGWHRISWCASSGAQSGELFACNRRTAVSYNSSGDLLGLTDFRLGHAREKQMILDVQWSKSVLGHCLVLTSTCMFWLSFMAQASGNADGGRETPRVLLVWQHFRDRGDRTLHMVLLETKLATTVLLISRVVDLGLVFRIGLVNGDRALPASLADPCSIFLPEHPYYFVPGRLPLSQLFRAVEFQQDGEIKDRSVDPYFFKLFSLYGDLSIVEHLYSSTEPGFRTVEAAGSLSALPKPFSKSVRSSRPTGAKLADFIVSDNWYEEDLYATGPCHRRLPRFTTERKYTGRARRTHDWQDVYDYLADEDNGLISNARVEMDAFSGRVADELNYAKSPGIHTLSEALSSGFHITDVDGDSEIFERLISEFNAQRTRDTRLERLPMGVSSGQECHKLTSIYDSIVTIHLAPLSPGVPDRARVNKERLARRVTADLLLASTAVSSISTATIEPLSSDIISVSKFSQSTDHLPSLARSTSQRSLSPTKASTVTEDESIINHLRSYTTISHPNTSTIPSISNNPILTSILRHFPTSPNINPESYDWHTTELSLAAEHEEELAVAAGKADPRAKRKAEKAKLARARKEEARRRAAMKIAASSRSMPRVLSSQAGIPEMQSSGERREVQSSQVKSNDWDFQRGLSQGPAPGPGPWVGQELPMTQPERGAFGTRSALKPAAGKKKDKAKKRAAGF